MSKKLITGLSCPSCGGAVKMEEGRNAAECEYCHTASIIVGEKGTRKYYVKDEIDANKVKQIAYDWFGKPDKAKDLKDTYEVEELFLVYVPFYRITSKVLGWILGKVEHQSRNGATYEKVEIRVNEDFDWNTPACDLGEFGVARVDLEGDNLHPFVRDDVKGRGLIFEPTLSRTEVDKDASTRLEQKLLAETKVDQITFRKYHELRRSLSIIYYPMWIMRYRYRNRTYQLVVDAEDGTLLFGKAPGNYVYRVAMLIGIMFLTNFLLTSSFFGGEGLVIIIGIFALPFMYVAYRKFRYGGEVVYEKYPSGLKADANEAIKAIMSFDVVTISKLMKRI